VPPTGASGPSPMQWWALRRRRGDDDRLSNALSAHSETVGADAKRPVRLQRQVATKAVTRAGYDCSTHAALIDVAYDELPGIMAFRAANTSQETPA
jgi:hypothetical protein